MAKLLMYMENAEYENWPKSPKIATINIQQNKLGQLNWVELCIAYVVLKIGYSIFVNFCN